MSFTIVCQDITKMKVDAIVNAANTDLAMGGGVCGAIFKAAGVRELQAACDQVAPIQTGEAIITPGFALAAKYIIHAAGPVYRQEDAGQSEQSLRSAYTNALRLATENKCESIAFPLISSGIYGYPKEDALQVATSAIRGFLVEHDMDVYLAVLHKAAFAICKTLLGDVASYIDAHYVEGHKMQRRPLLDVERKVLEVESMLFEEAVPDLSIAGAPSCLDDLVSNLDAPFSTALLRLIASKGKTDVEVYKRANLSRKLFSKIRTGKGYLPSKRTAVALAVALELDIDETDDLLERAGYALSRSQIFDVIVEYFIVNRKYDIFEINEVLFKYDQPLLGG